MLLRQLLLILFNARVLVQVLRQSQQNRLCRYGQVVIRVMVLILNHHLETSLLESGRKRVHPTACVQLCTGKLSGVVKDCCLLVRTHGRRLLPGRS
jgi:hypothetical protein